MSSDSKLLDESAREEARVVMRPKRPPRPKSEAFLGPHDHSNRRTKRFSAFGVRGSINCGSRDFSSTLPNSTRMLQHKSAQCDDARLRA